MTELRLSSSAPRSRPIGLGLSPRLRLLPAVVAGLYSWALTLLPIVLSEEKLGLATLSALIAVAVLILSLALPPGRIATLAAVDIFVLASALSWWSSRNLGVGVPFPIFGSLGWLFYILAVGAVSMPRSDEGKGVELQELRPRTPPSPLSALVLVLSILGAVTLILSAWRVERSQLSVLSQAFALCGALLLLRGGASLSVHIQRRRAGIRSDLSLGGAALPLLCFFALLLGGALWRLKSG